MDATLGTALIASPGACSDPSSLTPELLRSQSMAGESDDDSAHPTPSAMTPAAPTSPREAWSTAKTRSDLPHRAEDEVRKIHYIESPAQTITPQIGILPGAASAPAGQAALAPSEALTATPAAALAAATAPSSTASTPASTPAPTPQTYARKRGRPRKHPLPDPNNPPAKSKRKLSADGASASAQKKASTIAAARSAASSSASLLSVPDLGRLIPQGSTSDNAQNFIKNNLRLFGDLFVALQKQATTDHSVRDEAHSVPNSLAPGSSEPDLTPVTQNHSSSDYIGASSSASVAAVPAAGTSTSHQSVSGPSDGLRDEIRKKMADVTKGREAIQAEMLQMRVDASFFENAQKTVDERIIVLRERIAKHTAILQREREATRQAREASREAKKHRKAKEKGLRDSEREERRLAHTFVQLEREIAAEEEERRRLEEAESSDEDDDDHDKRVGGAQDNGAATTAGSIHTGQSWDALDQLRALDPAILAASPSEATSLSATATPPVSDTPAAQERAIGFSDEELAKVLGISTTELAGFSQTLEISSFPSAAQPLGATYAEPSMALQSESLLAQSAANAVAESQDTFDVAGFLEMASSLGAVAPLDSTQQSAGDTS